MLTKVLLGEFDFSQSIDCDKVNDYCSDPPREIDIAKIILHEDYRPRIQGSPYDIAIIKMTEFVEFSNFIKPICLPMFDEVNVGYGSGFVVAGFGRTEGKKFSEIMLKAEVDIVERNECVRNYRPQGRLIHSTQICAAKGNSDSW